MARSVTQFSVRRQSESKEYLWLVPDHGLELGFGAPGQYEAHAHRHFVDVIYSPSGLQVSPGAPEAHIAIVQPRTAFGPTVTEAFFFMKFLPTSGPHAIPEKVTGAALDDYARAPIPEQFRFPFTHDFTQFDPRDSTTHRIRLHTQDDVLFVSSTEGWELVISP